MTDKSEEIGLVFLLGAGIGSIFTGLLVHSVHTESIIIIKKAAIECGAAQHNPITGAFEFKKKE
jgi:hypothetical protein